MQNCGSVDLSSVDLIDTATSCKSASRVLVSKELNGEFRDFTGRVGSLFSVNLPVVDFENSPVSELKKFCGGLLEPSGRHQWAGFLRQIPARDRLSVAGSLFSFRKLLPSPGVDIPRYAERMSSEAPPADRRFLRFCTRELRRIFRTGWDREWRKFVLSTAPSGSSCLTKSKKQGGARTEALGRREWFLRSCYGLENPTIPTVRKLSVVETAGKLRIVSSSPWESVLLSPLHKLIYSKLSRMNWLLRGEADPSCFSDFVQKEGEVFVSGDYESATDNLKLDVSRHILQVILGRSSHIPRNIRREALDSLQCVLEHPGGSALQRRGQLMGNYLSFPLLCLQNFLAFRYYCGRDLPVKINGDDIVFRCPPASYEAWSRGVSSTGLTLSKGKTFVHRRFFCINSKYFCARREREPMIVPILRSSCLYGSCEDPNQVAGWVNRIGEGFDSGRSDDLKVAVLRKQSRIIRCAQRSLTRGLGCKVTAAVITRAGYRNWEGYYLDLPSEVPPPAKSSFGCIPQGWFRVECPLGGIDDPGFNSECVRSSWKTEAVRVTTDDYWAAVRSSATTYPKRGSSYFRRAALMLKVSVSVARRYLQPKLVIRRPVKRVWRKDDS